MDAFSCLTKDVFVKCFGKRQYLFTCCIADYCSGFVQLVCLATFLQVSETDTFDLSQVSIELGFFFACILLVPLLEEILCLHFFEMKMKPKIPASSQLLSQLDLISKCSFPWGIGSENCKSTSRIDEFLLS
jgi:hypothetical protein